MRAPTYARVWADCSQTYIPAGIDTEGWDLFDFNVHRFRRLPQIVEFFQHEKLIKKYITERGIDKVTVGGMEFTFTQDSFKLAEFDYE